jgi:hypothetical protein
MVGICCGVFGDPSAEKIRRIASASLADGSGFKIMSFCEPVRQVAKMVTGSKEPDLSTVNGVCITGRRIAENYWLNITLSRMDPVCDKIVFYDVFFSNEYRYIKSQGGLVVKLRVDDVPDGDFDFIPDVIVGYGHRDTENAFSEAVKKAVASFFDCSSVK